MAERLNIIAGECETPYRSESEAAQILDLSLRTLKNNRYAGNGRPYRKHGAKVVYDIDELKIHRARRKAQCLSVPPWPEHLHYDQNI